MGQGGRPGWGKEGDRGGARRGDQGRARRATRVGQGGRPGWGKEGDQGGSKGGEQGGARKGTEKSGGQVHGCFRQMEGCEAGQGTPGERRKAGWGKERARRGWRGGSGGRNHVQPLAKVRGGMPTACGATGHERSTRCTEVPLQGLLEQAHPVAYMRFGDAALRAAAGNTDAQRTP